MANEKRLIDANALLKQLDKFINPMPDANGLHFMSGLCTAITEIELAPTMDAVEVVHGRWIPARGINCFHYNCSACKGLLEWRSSYCPNCGAKMEVHENG